MPDIDPNFGEWLRARFRKLFAENHGHAPPSEKCPLKAPWPPGVNHRAIEHPLHGVLIQVREGGALPHELWSRLRGQALERFPGVYSLN
jgi:hypothetical protein